MKHVVFTTFLSMLIVSSTIASSEDKKRMHFTSGTGFFISEHHIVTNAHVVKACDFIRIRGGVPRTFGKIIAKDEESDLAIVEVPQTATNYAKISAKDTLKVSQPITIASYPLQNGIDGTYVIQNDVITDTKDGFYNDQRFQFNGIIEKGSSGGPVIDQYGAIIGVIAGKISFYFTGDDQKKSEPIKTSSVAIKHVSLKAFLDQNNVGYYTRNTDKVIQKKNIDTRISDFLVNIHCLRESPGV